MATKKAQAAQKKKAGTKPAPELAEGVLHKTHIVQDDNGAHLNLNVIAGDAKPSIIVKDEAEIVALADRFGFDYEDDAEELANGELKYFITSLHNATHIATHDHVSKETEHLKH